MNQNNIQHYLDDIIHLQNLINSTYFQIGITAHEFQCTFMYFAVIVNKPYLVFNYFVKQNLHIDYFIGSFSIHRLIFKKYMKVINVNEFLKAFS